MACQITGGEKLPHVCGLPGSHSSVIPNKTPTSNTEKLFVGLEFQVTA